jgi:hypothetical protein
MGKMRTVHKVLIANPERKGPHRRLREDGRIILRCILKERVWTGFISLRIGAFGGLF